jgi:hypothetical protein
VLLPNNRNSPVLSQGDHLPVFAVVLVRWGHEVGNYAVDRFFSRRLVVEPASVETWSWEVGFVLKWLLAGLVVGEAGFERDLRW